MAKQHAPRFLAIVESAREAIPECNPQELKLMLSDDQPLLVIDVRERYEF